MAGFMYVFYGFRSPDSPDCTFSLVSEPEEPKTTLFPLYLSLLRAPEKPLRHPPRNPPRTLGRSVRQCIFPIFVNLGGRRRQIGKFNNWGRLIIESGGYSKSANFTCPFRALIVCFEPSLATTEFSGSIRVTPRKYPRNFSGPFFGYVS